MEKIDLVLWFMGAGFSVMFTLLLMLWNSMNYKFDQIDARFEKVDAKFEKVDAKFDKVDARFDRMEAKFDKIDEDIKELRTSINRMEGAFYNKDCCILKDDQKEKAQ